MTKTDMSLPMSFSAHFTVKSPAILGNIGMACLSIYLPMGGLLSQIKERLSGDTGNPNSPKLAHHKMNSNRTALFAALFMAFIPASRADSPAPEVPLVFASRPSSAAYFVMVPTKFDKDYKIIREAFGVAYRADEDGKPQELYRVKGWYSFEVYLSDDGTYLVQMGPWSVGSEPEKEDLAVAFFKNGKMLKSYSTADLVKDPSKVAPTTSHYFWQAPSPLDDSIDPAEAMALLPRLDYDNHFNLSTIDGWTYVFDAKNGKIIQRKKTKG